MNEDHHILKYNEFILENKSSEYEKLFEEYKNSKFRDFKSFILDKSRRARDISKNVLKAFKSEGIETAEMTSVFNRHLRQKLNLKNRKDNPTSEELEEALKQLRDIPKLLPYAAVLLAAPIPGSSAMYTVFAYFLKKKSKGKINLLPDSFDNIFDGYEDKSNY